MTSRVNYAQTSPTLLKAYVAFNMALAEGSIDALTRELSSLRASQMNGCAFCVDMHVKKARILGERELRLHHIAIWRESELFSPRERAVLEWTEALTKLGEHGVSDEIYTAVREELSEKEISDLTFSLIAINGWNRAQVAFRVAPGSQDKTYGLEKANLS